VPVKYDENFSPELAGNTHYNRMHGMGKFAVISPIIILNYFDEQVTSPYQELKTGCPVLNTVSVLTKLSLLPYADVTSREVRHM
jgi:hypothetical protein